MKNTKFTRIVVPLSTGCTLMLALSACMTVERANPGKSEGSSLSPLHLPLHHLLPHPSLLPLPHDEPNRGETEE